VHQLRQMHHGKGTPCGTRLERRLLKLSSSCSLASVSTTPGLLYAHMVAACTTTTPAGESGPSSLAESVLLHVMTAVSVITMGLQVTRTACMPLILHSGLVRRPRRGTAGAPLHVALTLSPLAVLIYHLRQLNA
jgi:hypothetical protein